MIIRGRCTIFDRTQNNIDKSILDGALPRTDFQRLVRVDPEGLHVGDSQSNSEALIDSESFSVVIGGHRYSKLAANYTQHGSYQMRETADGGMAFVFV